MRKTLYHLAEPIRQKISSNMENHSHIEVLLSVELVAVAYDKLQIKVPLKEAWSLLTGYNEPILSGDLSQEIIQKLRMLIPNFSAESRWLDALEIYRQIDDTYRLINLDTNSNFTFNTPRLDPRRRDFYVDILTEKVPYKESEKKFAGAGKFFYYKPSIDLKTVKEGNIPKTWIRQNKQLPAYRKKKKISFNLNFDWLNIAKEIDKHLGGRRWVETFKPIEFRAIKGGKEFHYEGLQHVVGGLAAGKSSFQWINTYWLVKHKKAKIGLIVNSVADLLEVVHELESLGINVAPIIGRSNRAQHLKNELLRGDYFTIDSLTDSKLKSLSGICPIKALAGDFDYEKNPYYPCEWLYSGSKTAKLCPLVHTCGVYKDWTKIVDADVWVTTAAAVLSTKVPAVIDPYKRTLYEAMYDLLDVIFVDEADQVQQRFEEQFIQEEDAFGKPFQLVGRLEQHYYEKIRSNVHYIGNPMIEAWHANLNHLSETSNLLMGILKNSNRLRSLFRNNVIYLNFFIYKLVRKISANERQQEQLMERFIRFTQSVDYGGSRVTERDLHSVIRMGRELEQTKVIKNWLQAIGAKIPNDEKDLQRLIVDIKAFVYLANIEASLKYVKYNYQIVQQHTNLEQFSLLSMSQDFRPITKEAMTGVMFGYRYEQKSGEQLGSIKIIQYLAVGKDLLFNWPTAFETVDHRRGPGVILLSGTSYAPQSLHYHIEYEPKWFISSTRQKSILKQRFLPVKNPDDHEKIINISGIRDEGKRVNNLRMMVIQLRRKIEKELAYWKEKGENRKVLLVVNSYDDVPVVGEALDATGKFEGKYRLLSKGDRNDGRYFPRTLIELFPNEEADILVAPLMAISRGYNIMKDNRAYFGSAFFLVRPYPVPNDLSYFVQVLHGHLPLYLAEIAKENKHFVDGIRYLRKRARGAFELMYKNPGFWSSLKESERKVLAWYTLIPTWQLIGRLLRHGSDARVFYCDGRFGIPSRGNSALLDYWQRIMEEKDDQIFNSLYGPFKDSIGNVKKEVVYHE